MARKSAKPPINTALASSASKKSHATAEDDLDEAANLKKDLALQRLLAESHLFDSSSKQFVNFIVESSGPSDETDGN